MKKKFSWQKKRLILSLFLVSATFFLIYQLIFMFLLGSSENNKSALERIDSETDNLILKVSVNKDDVINIFNSRGMIRGIQLSDIQKYKPNQNGKFVCFDSKTEIEYSMINDDYCDCPEDGSDEPGTNACNNGLFYCEHQPRNGRNKPLSIPSSRVNDGVCDCCDGSDEWGTPLLPPLIHPPLPLSLQHRLGRHHAPCANYCFTHFS